MFRTIWIKELNFAIALSLRVFLLFSPKQIFKLSHRDVSLAVLRLLHHDIMFSVFLTVLSFYNHVGMLRRHSINFMGFQK